MKPVRTVCIVDDDPVYQFATQKIVEYSELAENIISFSEGRAMLRFLEEQAQQPEKLPDLVFLDLNMPLMDGWEFLRHYEALKPRLARGPVICIVTSSTNPIDVNRALGLRDVFDYIIKPLMPDKLEELVKRIGSGVSQVRSAS